MHYHDFSIIKKGFTHFEAPHREFYLESRKEQSCLSTIRRNKLEIFNDILKGINDEIFAGEVKPTKVGHRANMSYDRLTKYLKELEDDQLITNSPLNLTEKGRQFIQDYEKIKDFVNQMKIDYMNEGEHKL